MTGKTTGLQPADSVEHVGQSPDRLRVDRAPAEAGVY